MPERIKVVMLGAYPLDASHLRGGVQAAYAYLVKGLVRTQALDLHILTFKPSGYQGPDQIQQNNLTLHLLPSYPRFERLRNYSNYQRIINKKLLQIQPDLIHAQDAGADALVAIRSGLPTVITIHGIRWEDGKHYSSLLKKLRVYFDSLLTEQYTVRHADYLIAISPYVTRYFKNLLRPSVKVFDVPNAIDERFFLLDSEPVEPVILFAGRVIPRKRVLDLVQAFAKIQQKIPNARLHIAGEIKSEPGYVETIRKWVQAAQLNDKVSFLGPLSEEAVYSEFAHCCLLALPSAQETAPMVIAQAMAAGKPIIATPVGGVKEMVGEDNSRGLLVDIGDIDGLSAAMLFLLQNPRLQKEMGQCGKLFSQKNYHLESVAQRTNAIYHSIVHKEQ
jgi:glycosyltransferase involved in cell wall biosynthesis